MKKLIIIGFVIFEFLEFVLFASYIYFKGINVVASEFISDLIYLFTNIKGLF